MRPDSRCGMPLLFISCFEHMYWHATGFSRNRVLDTRIKQAPALQLKSNLFDQFGNEMNTVRKLFAETLKVPPDSISGETSMDNTEVWDSLKHMELIVGIEKLFDVILDGDEIALMISVSAVEAVLKKKGVEI